MPGWREGDGKVTFADMPRHLVEVGPNSPEELKQQQRRWLEKHDLTFVDFLSWKRAQGPEAGKRPPSRRKFLSSRERAALDAEREREGFQW